MQFIEILNYFVITFRELLCNSFTASSASKCLNPQLISAEDLKLSRSITYDRSMSQIP